MPEQKEDQVKKAKFSNIKDNSYKKLAISTDPSDIHSFQRNLSLSFQVLNLLMDQKKDLFAVPCYLHFPQLMFDIIFYQMCRPRKKENYRLILMKSRAEKSLPQV